MDIDDSVTVTLPRWKWLYFLGWIDAQKPGGNNLLMSVIEPIAAASKPDS